ncbi:tyrosine-protein phosphatase [Ligilactobacillus animalis]|uniref:tyrosine-protein phosphatase n=1 Tax=Ligilactobacillus animalis TaxID=1605 RepID=UPI0010A3C58B|nr:CpsB/CapC family capsule biosynthesis tyrosine phosphatase [Ligilactobacillus animalis]MDO5883747.1 tyrosine protein phosphatase [Ligilactobacillus animalis]MDU8986425.1 CpsB/CapC family capsule biosynthesis tyrosine phosphatase [Ligilactobacillus animalis]THE19629.1 tyrosine protein phosphatase [Ligilactobacillus animalis]THE21041.1 tyrosine protein phosphatase [Ligilactobacillus animalis]
MDFEKIVDLHCHILPGIDDGSQSLEDSIALANEAVKDGVTHILATPHHLDNKYVNHRSDVERLVKNFQAELDSRQIPLKIFPGQEVHINGELVQKYDDLLGVDLKKKYMLLEFPHSNVPAYAEKMIFELLKLGTTPIIVHPERNKEIQKNTDILYKFIQQGALAQVTATSYIGGFGDDVAKLSQKFVAHNLVQIVASDAHAMRGRDFVLSEALSQIGHDFGKDKAIQFEKNAEDLINGFNVMASNYSQIAKKKHFFFF